MSDPLVRDILTFWFGNAPYRPLANAERWFRHDPAFDAEVHRNFRAPWDLAARGLFRGWWHRARPALAYVILTDQFPRNLFRDDARAFRTDALALECCERALAVGLDDELSLVERWFLAMPLMHSEALAHQEAGVTRLKELAQQAAGGPADIAEALREALDFAERHRDVIARFGRFPHRNALLGRTTTPEEQAWLDEHGGF